MPSWFHDNLITRNSLREIAAIRQAFGKSDWTRPLVVFLHALFSSLLSSASDMPAMRQLRKLRQACDALDINAPLPTGNEQELKRIGRALAEQIAYPDAGLYSPFGEASALLEALLVELKPEDARKLIPALKQAAQEALPREQQRERERQRQRAAIL